MNTTESTVLPIPVISTCSYLYKYSDFSSAERKEWLKEIILEHRIYVPTLSQLNDPLDGRPRLVSQSADQLFSLAYNPPYGILGRNPRMSLEEQTLHGLIVERNITEDRLEPFNRYIVRFLYSHWENRWRVYSMSKRYDNSSLWAHYAGNSSGYCLEFANKGPFGSAREVVYGDTFAVDISNRKDLDGRWIFCKKREWCNEEEVRIFSIDESKIDFPSSVLARVILGRKMKESDQQMIREWAKQRQPELTVALAYYDELDQQLKLRTI